jgi:hypothetical protein
LPWSQYRSGLLGEPPSGDVIPISADNPLTTAGAVCALAHLVMDIAGVDEMQADREKIRKNREFF